MANGLFNVKMISLIYIDHAIFRFYHNYCILHLLHVTKWFKNAVPVVNLLCVLELNLFAVFNRK